jgi:acetyl esterase/lipase
MNILVTRRRRALTLELTLAAVSLFGAHAAKAEAPVLSPISGSPALAIGSYDISALGYGVQEFFVEGKARSFKLSGNARTDGNWHAVADQSAPYKTRLVVILPTDPRKFNGTVVVEWLNVSGGLDVPVDWITLHRELVRRGYGYVGVSAQKVGVEGGPNLARGRAQPLKTADPTRYGSLSHPGDAYSFDIFSDVARLLRGSQSSALLGRRKPQRIIAVGESQSAFYLTTYVNAVDPLTKLYDGFLIHSRSGVAAPLDGASLIGAPIEILQKSVKLRADLRVPVMQVITETDLMGLANSIGFHAARQPDAKHLRTWEIAGTAHADNYLFGVGSIDSGSLPLAQLAAAWAPLDNVQGLKLPHTMNNAPQHHYVTEAALWQLDHWLRTGDTPPHAVALELNQADPPALALDGKGNAQGGVRTPWVDAPVSKLSGLGAPAEIPLVGTSQSLDAAVLQRLYPKGRDDYLHQFSESLDKAIADGFILTADRQEIIDLASVSFPDTAAPRPMQTIDDAMKVLLPVMSYAVIPNITYRTVEGWQGKLDVMTPRAAKGPTPTLVYYHGGGWTTGSKEERMPLVLPYMLMGWTIVNVEYRLSDVALAPAAAEDARCALRWVFEHANETLKTSTGPVPLNIDLKRVVTSGTSAGGHLALLVAMAPVSAGLDHHCHVEQAGGAPVPAAPKELKVAAVVDWFGISDLQDLLSNPRVRPLAIGWLGDKSTNEQIAKLVSPITYVRADVPPIISVHGDSDPGVPYAQKVRFHEKLERVGATHELITIKGGGHGIFTATDYLRAYASVHAFLTTHLGLLEFVP